MRSPLAVLVLLMAGTARAVTPTPALPAPWAECRQVTGAAVGEGERWLHSYYGGYDVKGNLVAVFEAENRPLGPCTVTSTEQLPKRAR